MLYRWLNGGKPPFVDPTRPPSQAALAEAEARRMRGERPPLPAGEGVDPAFAEAVRRAVEPDPADRWESPAQLRGTLCAYAGLEDRDTVESAPESTVIDSPASGDTPLTVHLWGAPEDSERSFGSDQRGVPGEMDDKTVAVVPRPPLKRAEPREEPRDAQGPDVGEVPRRRSVPLPAVMAAVALVACFLVALLNRPSVPEYSPADSTETKESNPDPAPDPAPETKESNPEPTSEPALHITQEQAAEAATAISAGGDCTVGLHADGTVVAVGDNGHGQCGVSGWEDVVAVATGNYWHTVGLCADGTVVAAGDNGSGQCDVYGWEDVVAVSAGSLHTVGLRTDGTVVATGSNAFGQCDVSGWRDVVAVAAGGDCTVGLRADGTVVATGYNTFGQCDVSGWRDVVAVSVGFHTVGLLADGTVVATGENDYGQCDVSGWHDVVAISASGGCTVGLRADGTVVATGYNGNGRCDVSDWHDIRVPSSLRK